MVRLREGIQTVDQYIPGRRAPVHDDGPALLGLASNECPYAPFPSVLSALDRAGKEANRYASAFAEPLREVVAERWGVAVDRVAAGAGSMALCTQALLATCDGAAEVVYASPSFVGYPLMASIAGARAVPVPVTAGRHDLDAMAARITDRTRAVFVCNPNNPTGTTVTAAELGAFLETVPSDCLVILDEAYAEFDDPSSALDSRAFLDVHDNLMVSRTFSKAYGMAGLRVGYAVAGPEVAGIIQSTLPFNVSGPAMAGAIAALQEDELLADRVAEVRRERTRVLRAARQCGLDLPDSQGNFVWFPTTEGIVAVDDALERARILSRMLPPFGVRVTLGTPQDNDRLIETFTELASPGIDTDVVARRTEKPSCVSEAR